jgi:hypothetical protein
VRKSAIKIVGRSKIEIVVDVARNTAAGFVLAAILRPARQREAAL